jgi:hypothetical protein
VEFSPIICSVIRHYHTTLDKDIPHLLDAVIFKGVRGHPASGLWPSSCEAPLTGYGNYSVDNTGG